MEAKHLEGPWMVFLDRIEGSTYMHVAHHTHAAIALARDYWPEDYSPPTDEDGYCQPDERADIADHLVVNARLIAAAPAMFEALTACETVLAGRPSDLQIALALDAARTALAAAQPQEPQ